MLYADIVDTSNDEVRSITWHAGDKNPRVYENEICPRIQADGDELNFIAAKFSNIPMYKGPVVVWTGEIAQFIFENLFS